MHVHHDPGRSVRVVSRIGVVELRFEDVLHPRVDRQLQVRAVDRLLRNLDRIGDLSAGDVLLGHDVARRAGQEVVLRSLHAVLAGAIDVDVPDQLRGERRPWSRSGCRVDAQGLRQQADARQRKGPNGVRDERIDPAPEPEPRLGAGELGYEVGLWELEQTGENVRLEFRVADLRWGGVDRIDLDRCREQLAPGVQNDASLGRDLLILRELVCGHRRKPVVLENVPEREPPADDSGDQGQEQQEDECAGAAVGPGKHARLLAASRAGSSVSGLVLAMAWCWMSHSHDARMRRTMDRVGGVSAGSLPRRGWCWVPEQGRSGEPAAVVRHAARRSAPGGHRSHSRPRRRGSTATDRRTRVPPRRRWWPASRRCSSAAVGVPLRRAQRAIAAKRGWSAAVSVDRETRTRLRDGRR